MRHSKTYYNVYISYIFVTDVMLKELDRFCFCGNLCCIMRRPSGEPIVDVVSGETEFEPQVKTGELVRPTHLQ